MPQQTNLNVSPYFDDFDPSDDFHKVLFKPGYPVQARELTGLQSILQNQIEKFGDHIFREGSKVIPGQLSYQSDYYAVQVEAAYFGIPVSFYADKFFLNFDEISPRQKLLRFFSKSMIISESFFKVIIFEPLIL